MAIRKPVMPRTTRISRRVKPLEPAGAFFFMEGVQAVKKVSLYIRVMLLPS
jgi:hypothetical protein